MQHVHQHSSVAIGDDARGFFGRLLDTGFVPRAECFHNDAGVIWLHVVSDVMIAAAYFSIPVALVLFAMRRRGLSFHWMFLLFGAFILLCGTTHIFDVLAVWRPVYRLDGVVKAMTAVASIGTAAALWPLIPRALMLPCPATLRAANRALEREVEERRAAQEELQLAREDLEIRVEERTSELAAAKRTLESEVDERRAVEEELVKHRTRLEELVRERTAELAASHERLRQSERMASLGTLAAGLGHDMGNLLLPVRTRLDSLQAAAEGDELSREGAGEDLVAIRKCVEHLQRLSTGLRLFAYDSNDEGGGGDGGGGRGRTELAPWRADVEPFLKNALPRGVEFLWDLDAGTPAVALAAHRLTQAVFNLVQNAGEALAGTAGGREGGGRVRIWSRPGPGGSVLVGVSDNGPGMSEEVRRRCLEPFYSSKVRGISTGLGLPLVHGIVQRAGGAVRIESGAGRGTTITLELPAPGAPAGGERERAVVSIGDARVRSFVRDMLGELGFEAEVSADHDTGAVGASGVWVTDGGPAAAAAAGRLLAEHPVARVLVIGPVAEDRWGTLAGGGGGAGGGAPGGVRFIGGDRFSPARLRDALRAILRPERSTP